MIQELKYLNDKFYKIFDDLKQASPVVGNAYPVFAENILEQYRTEYTLLALRNAIEEETEIFELQERYNTFVPRRWRRFLRKRKNTAAKLLEIKVNNEAQEHFNKMARELGLISDEKAADVNSEREGEEISAKNEDAPSETTSEPGEEGLDQYKIE